jgi:hypothetical protein
VEFCKGRSPAYKRYQRDLLRLNAIYLVVVLSAAWFVKHDGANHFFLYFWSVLPAIPVIAVIARMGQYLQEEKDEYQRVVVMRSILMGTAALLGLVVVNDFVRLFTNSAGVPPFVEFVVFCVAMAAAQWSYKLRDRVRDDEPTA